MYKRVNALEIWILTQIIRIKINLLEKCLIRFMVAGAVLLSYGNSHLLLRRVFVEGIFLHYKQALENQLDPIMNSYIYQYSFRQININNYVYKHFGWLIFKVHYYKSIKREFIREKQIVRHFVSYSLTNILSLTCNSNN